MVLPPRHVYSGTVVNSTSAALRLKAVYSVPPDGHPETVELDIAADATAALGEKTVVDGTATFIGNIVEVTVTAANGKTASAKAPLKVASPVRDYVFLVSADTEGNLSIAEPKGTFAN
jgi:hypothetical protein